MRKNARNWLRAGILVIAVLLIYLVLRHQQEVRLSLAVRNLKDASNNSDTVVHKARFVSKPFPAQTTKPTPSRVLSITVNGHPLFLPMPVREVWFHESNLNLSAEQRRLTLIVDGDAGRMEQTFGEAAAPQRDAESATTAPVGTRLEVFGQPVEYRGDIGSLMATWADRADLDRRLSVSTVGSDYGLSYSVGGETGQFELALREESTDAVIAAGGALEFAGVTDGRSRVKQALDRLSRLSSQQLFERIAGFDESTLYGEHHNDVDNMAEDLLLLVGRLTSPPLSGKDIYVVEHPRITCYVIDQGEDRQRREATVLAFDANGKSLFDARLDVHASSMDDVIEFLEKSLIQPHLRQGPAKDGQTGTSRNGKGDIQNNRG